MLGINNSTLSRALAGLLIISSFSTLIGCQQGNQIPGAEEQETEEIQEEPTTNNNQNENDGDDNENDDSD